MDISSRIQVKANKEKTVVVCIPVYKDKLSVFEQVSLKQLNKVLDKYQRVFLAPISLQFDYGKLGEEIVIERFPDYYFYDVICYSAFMLSKELYQCFADYEYMLVYQTDAFVFSDKLQDFCAMDSILWIGIFLLHCCLICKNMIIR